MLYRIISNGAVLTQGEIRKLYANTSLPRVWTEAICASMGIAPILASPKPECGPLEHVVSAGVKMDAKGNWVESWAVAPMFGDYEDEDGKIVTKSEQEQAYMSRIMDERWQQVRSQRNEKLAATDWTQVADSPVDKDAWATYRQALRDVPSQSDPQNITWPDEPVNAN